MILLCILYLSDFIDKVGMVLVHNGTVRNWSRGDGRTVVALETEVDTEKVESLRQEYKKHQGIYEILVEARSGKFYPGDDLLFIIVAVAYGIYWFLVLRHVEETDDAYVAGNQVQIMAQVSGSVTKVWADNTDFVQQGDPLVTLDQTDAQQAFEKAKTALASSVRNAHQLIINNKQYQANVELQAIRCAIK